MPSSFPYTLQPLGEAAILIDFGNAIDEKVNREVLKIFNSLCHYAHPAITNLVPAYASLAVFYNLMKIQAPVGKIYETLRDELQSWIEQSSETDSPDIVLKEVPVCYSPRFAPDLEWIHEEKKIAVEDIIRIHTEKIYRVYMIGFLPGFPYMGTVDDALAVNRKTAPRKRVPAGAVGIAGRQTGIYPMDAPGGWQIIGRTPLKIFDSEKTNPVFFQPGNSVKFYSITEDEFENYQSRPS